jgi:hypothetical protein
MSSLRPFPVLAFVALVGLCDEAWPRPTERRGADLAASPNTPASAAAPLSHTDGQDDKENARVALKALLDLASATADGLNYREFTAKLKEVKGVVEEALRKMGGGPLRDEIAKSLRYYEDARNYWREKAEKQVSALTLSEDEVRELKERYGPGVESAVSPAPDPPKKRVAIEPLVKAIWEQAASIALLAERKRQKQ